MRKLFPIFVLLVSTTAFAQVNPLSSPPDTTKSVTTSDDVNTLMRLEHERKIKKIKDEINKSEAPPLPAPVTPAPIVDLPKKKVEPPVLTTAIFGVAPYYRGDLLVRGARYPQVRVGTKVAEYMVVNITPDGIELEKQDLFSGRKSKVKHKPSPNKKASSSKHSAPSPKFVTTLVYAPLVRDGI